MSNDTDTKNSKVMYFIFVLVVSVWALAALVDIFTDYEVPAPVTGLVLAIIGYFTREAWKK